MGLNVCLNFERLCHFLARGAQPDRIWVHSQKAAFAAGLCQPRQGRVPVLDFFVLSYFRVFAIDPEELPWAMTSSRFPRGSSRPPSPFTRLSGLAFSNR